MASVELEIVRSGSSEFIVQALPDGSTAIFEVATKNVYSLNPSAAAAWEACASATTLSRLAAEMSRRLNKPVTEDLAHEAVSELVAAGLVSATPAERLGTSRREMLKQVAGVALPVVLVLTGAEQRAHAQTGASGTSTTQAGSVSTTTQGPVPPLPLEIRKAIAASFNAVSGRTPLEGAEFDVTVAATGVLVGHIVTDSQGRVSIDLIPGVAYIFTETAALPSLADYVPFPPQTFVMREDVDFLDLNNVLKVT